MKSEQYINLFVSSISSIILILKSTGLEAGYSLVSKTLQSQLYSMFVEFVMNYRDSSLKP